MGWLKTVIHVHTHYSPDSNLSPAELIAAAGREGIDCVAITDHDEIRGALEVQRAGRVRVIVGQEVSTRDGHLIGLFLHERIPPGLSAEQTSERIRAQGGLVLAPHPFARLCSHSLKRAAHRLVGRLDAVEVLNAQNPLAWEDARAARFARRHGLAAYVGADAHLRGRIGPAYQMMPHFEGPGGFLAALRSARLCRGRYGPGCWLGMTYQHVWRKVVGAPPRGFGVRAARLGSGATAACESAVV
jgi:predicted metal-dependent phosphoesterase TrpH